MLNPSPVPACNSLVVQPLNQAAAAFYECHQVADPMLQVHDSKERLLRRQPGIVALKERSLQCADCRRAEAGLHSEQTHLHVQVRQIVKSRSAAGHCQIQRRDTPVVDEEVAERKVAVHVNGREIRLGYALATERGEHVAAV
jgi:hypothetical protein